jgi:cell division control protein 6
MNTEARKIPENPVENLQMLNPDYIPERIIHRNDILEPVLEVISTAIHKNRDRNIVLYGTSGTGKYTFSMDLKNQLEKQLKNSRKTLHSAIIDGRKYSTRNQIFSEIIRQIDPENPAIKGKKYSPYSEDILDELITSKDVVFFVIIKNLDHMEDDYILHYFTYFNELTYKDYDSYITKTSCFITLVIPSAFNWKENISSNILSRYKSQSFVIHPLSEKEVYDILKERAESLPNKTLDDGVIAKCAKTGAEYGNTDRAIRLLKSSIIIAEKSHSNHITLEHFDQAFAMTLHEDDVNFIADELRYLPLQKKLILNSILELLENNNNVTTGQVYQDYLSQCKTLRINPISTIETFSENITYLDKSEFIQTQMMYRGRKGNTRQITVEEYERDLMKEAMTNVLREQF